MKCPKCNSPNVYGQDGEHACMMCGNRWPMNGVNPVIPLEALATLGKYNRQKEKTMTSYTNRKKPCRNCERTMLIMGNGLCGGCYYAVKNSGHEKGTPEYDVILAAAKERFTSTDHKRTTVKLKSKKLSPETIKKLKTKGRVLLSIKHNGGDPEMCGVIAKLQTERNAALAKADKLAQAIKLLS